MGVNLTPNDFVNHQVMVKGKFDSSVSDMVKKPVLDVGSFLG